MAVADRVNPEHRKLLRVEERNRETPIEKKPGWIKTTATVGSEYTDMRNRMEGASLHTVCAEANCPNIYECWEDREASFLIGGDICTRRCDFCFIKTGKPTEYDRDEPRRVAESVVNMRLNYVTVTGVTRDDLDDGASWLYAETCREIHRQSPTTGVELLIDDMRGGEASLRKSSNRSQKSWRTTSKRFRESLRRSARHSATNVLSISSRSRPNRGLLPSPT